MGRLSAETTPPNFQEQGDRKLVLVRAIVNAVHPRCGKEQYSLVGAANDRRWSSKTDRC